MRFGSVCSGIEAASVAWEPLGWKASWVSEIEAFPSAVLKHHWPEVPNLGDMLKLPAAVSAEIVDAPDVLVGGTPCQAFSVAGRRESLEDERGALTLAYVELANAIDEQRRAAGKPPAIIVWENVPGVLSTKDNAFGCFLAGLAGEDVPLVAAGGKWSNAGAVFGPARAVAWRILDAQYFGVAQRRRRVFVVASARDGFDPATVLFEFDGVRRDSAPRRETGQGPAAAAGSGPAGSHWDDLTNPHPSLNQSHNTGGIGASNQEVFSQRGAGIVPAAGCFWNGEQVTQTLDAVLHKGQTMPEKNRFPAVLQPQNDNAPQAIAVGGDIAHTLKAEVFDASEDGTGRGVPTIAFHPTQDPISSDEVSHAVGCGSSTGQASVAVTVAGFQSSQSGVRLVDTHATLDANNGPRRHNGVVQAMAVRRLTPRECERLQGFPDDHTLVPHRGKPAADGPRYKALGNSMAVPVMRWIGQRIVRHLSILEGDIFQ